MLSGFPASYVAIYEATHFFIILNVSRKIGHNEFYLILYTVTHALTYSQNMSSRLTHFLFDENVYSTIIHINRYLRIILICEI